MAFKQFIKLMIYAVLAGLIIYTLLGQLMPLYKYSTLAWLSVIFFFLLSLLIYLLGERALSSNKNGSFLSIVVINTFLKLILSFVFVYIYVEHQQPNDKYFIIPFFIFYLAFMVAETYFLTVQASKSKVN